jgi:transposase
VGPHGVDSATRSARAKAGRKSRYQRDTATPLFAAGVSHEEIARRFEVDLATVADWHRRIKADVWRVDTRDYRFFPRRRARGEVK